MTPMTAEAMEKSRELAESLGQTPEWKGQTVRVPSRTTAGLFYEVTIALDGTPICGCPAAMRNLNCWHVAYVKEEVMTTESSTALVPVQLRPTVAALPTERELKLIDRAAQMAMSGAITLPRELNTPQKVATVMLYGWELGLKPLTSIRHIFIINGRPQPSAEVMAGMLIAHEPDARLSVVEIDNTHCTLRLLRPRRHVDAQYTVTWADIERAKLNKDVALLYPQDRMRWHCTKRLLRIYAPDVINALDVVGSSELDDGEDEEFDESEFYNDGDRRVNTSTGEIIDAEAQQTGPAVEQEQASPPAAAPAKAAKEPTAPYDLLNAIVKKHGLPAKVEAINIMSRTWGTTVITRLDLDERAVFALMLRARLDELQHDHDLSYTASGFAQCMVCGEPMQDPDDAAPQAGASTQEEPARAGLNV